MHKLLQRFKPNLLLHVIIKQPFVSHTVYYPPSQYNNLPKRLFHGPQGPNKTKELLHKEQGAKAVARALMGNSIITLLKFLAYSFSGSAAMLSEAIHTLIDSFNQALLWLGLRQASKLPDSKHQYGYGRATYFWSLVSAMGMFWIGCIGCGYQGVMHMLYPPAEMEFGILTVLVLGVSFVIDGTVFVSVLKDISSTKPKDVSLYRYIKGITDPMVWAVLMEDFAACTGVLIATAGIFATHITGNPIWDGVAGLTVGALLGLVSLSLISMNSRFLIGKSVDPSVHAGIRDILLSRASIENVYFTQSQWVGPYTFTYKAQIDFSGAYFASLLPAYIDQMLNVNDPEKLKTLLAWYTEDITRLQEREIRSIERQIQALYPEAGYIELEPYSEDMDESLVSAKFMTAEQSKILKDQLDRIQHQEEEFRDEDSLGNEYRRYN